MSSASSYPLIDLFAGPGGLGEGFASVQGERDERRFRSAISIEKDEIAHQTLQLRHFFHAFKEGEAPDAYYDYLHGAITKEELFCKYKQEAKEAEKSARKITLGEHCHSDVRKLICSKLNGHRKWVLVGGPPCQAYSLVGRSRMMGAPGFEKDERHRLYREYLRVLYDHHPPVFVMENVKGLLSATVRGKSTINQIISDLKNPGRALGNGKDPEYRLYDLTSGASAAEGEEPRRYMVRAEEHGVPQARHRMFIVGIRADLNGSPEILHRAAAPTTSEAIGDLPRLRSRISRGQDSYEDWCKIVSASLPGRASKLHRSQCGHFPKQHFSRRYSGHPKSNHPIITDLFDSRLSSLLGHEARSHMESDLRRYRFASLFADKEGRSPTLADFPKRLMPDHISAIGSHIHGSFLDRFRVQLADRPATTVTSHISKDGHYYIHYDPDQCRSLTVREAARLQTFPDNYKFEGPRTAQYHQVGNAVPPYLAKQIGEIVAQLLDSMNGEA